MKKTDGRLFIGQKHVSRDNFIDKLIAREKEISLRSNVTMIAKNVQYYDLKKNWNKIKLHLNDKELNEILVHDVNRYTYGRWKKKFTFGEFPSDRITKYSHSICRRGPEPGYFKYVGLNACHWLVSFNLKLAMLTEPNRNWRILTSEKHSTVWDGDKTLLEFNFYFSEVTPRRCFLLATFNDKKNNIKSQELLPGERYEPEYAQFWKDIKK